MINVIGATVLYFGWQADKGPVCAALFRTIAVKDAVNHEVTSHTDSAGAGRADLQEADIIIHWGPPEKVFPLPLQQSLFTGRGVAGPD